MILRCDSASESEFLTRVYQHWRADETAKRRASSQDRLSCLDQLVGGLRAGQSYLFYGASSFIDDLVHRLMVSVSAGGKVAYMDNTDYYSEKTLVRPDRMAFHAKKQGLDPDLVLEQIYFVAAYNELRQEKAVNALVKMVVAEEPTTTTTRLIIIHNIARFLPDARDKRQAIDSLNKILARVWRIVAERGLVLVMTAAFPSSANRWWAIPKPLGSSMMWHLANVIVFFVRQTEEEGLSSPHLSSTQVGRLLSQYLSWRRKMNR